MYGRTAAKQPGNQGQRWMGGSEEKPKWKKQKVVGNHRNKYIPIMTINKAWKQSLKISQTGMQSQMDNATCSKAKPGRAMDCFLRGNWCRDPQLIAPMKRMCTGQISSYLNDVFDDVFDSVIILEQALACTALQLEKPAQLWEIDNGVMFSCQLSQG